MKYVLCLAAAVAIFLAAAILLAAPPRPAVLAKDGQSAGCIVLPAGESDKGVVKAANDLSVYLKEMSGADVPVLRDNETCPGFRVLVGSTRFAPVKASEVSRSKVGFDGFIIKSAPNGLVLAGRTPKATKWAVYHFADYILGVRWYTVEDDGPTIPKRSTVTIPKLNLTVKPDFAWRCQWWSFQVISEAHTKHTSALAKKLAVNRDTWWEYNRQWGINAEVGHAYEAIVPRSLFAEHPEYFPYINYTFKEDKWAPFNAQVIPADADGNLPAWPWKSGRYGVNDSFQRCFSNPAVLDLTAKATARQFAADSTLEFASLSNNDGPWWCACDNCKAMGRTDSYRALTFANRVAAGNRAEFPDRGYFMLAYSHTLEPPSDMMADPAIVPIVAPLWQCRIHPISSDCPDCVYMRKVYTEWSRICHGRIGYYPYTTPGPFTFPGPMGLAEEMRFIHKLGGLGYIRENQFTPKVGWAMMNWIDTRLMWNIKLDVAKLRREFIENYYGKLAAKPIERIYIAIEKGAAESVTGKASSYAGGNGLHEWENGYEAIGATLENCRPDIDKALAIAAGEQEKFKYRIARDMKTLTGEEQSEF
jgi:hypothetical protein